jgi:hypothetical protein
MNPKLHLLLMIPITVASLMLWTGSATSAPAARPDVAWEETAKGGAAPDRAYHSMIYDPVNQLFWSYGGVQGDPTASDFKDTLLRLDATMPDAKWQVVPIESGKPPALAFHTAVYDSKRQRMLIYGGLQERNGFTSASVASGTGFWALDLRNPDAVAWTRGNAGNIPVDRFAHAAVYLPDLDVMIVAGGAQSFATLTSTVYAIQLSARPITALRLPNAGFNIRAGHMLTYDAVGQRLLAYGGLSRFDPLTTQNDVVWLDLSKGLEAAGDWRRLSTTSTGLKRAFMAAAFDPLRRLWWVQGGSESTSNVQRDLSVLDLNTEPPTWVRTQEVRNGPLERFGHAAQWDGPRDRAVFQGGSSDNERTVTNTYLLKMLDALATPTATGSATAAATTGTPTGTPTGTASAVPTSPTPGTGTATVLPSDTAAATATATEDPGTPSATATATQVDTPTVTPTATELPTETATPTATASTSDPAGKIYLPFLLKPRRPAARTG